MTSVFSEHKLQLQPSHQLLSLKKSLRDIDIPVPPRKLFTRRSSAVHDGSGDMFSDENFLRHKYLPRNNGSTDDEDDEDDPYTSDEFRMFEFKVRRCTRSRSHDWTDCPFAHPGEKARRRDPRRFHYSGTVCPEFRRGQCSRGDTCEFSHGVFECWLHPSRYRTEACKDGKNCKRKVCFFAHTPRQLRVLPSSDTFNKKKCNNINPNNNNNKNNHCCLFCHCSSSTRSPTSTLFGMSHFSPPLSPSSPSSPTIIETNQHFVKYNDDMFSELMNSMEGLNFGEASLLSSSASKPHKKEFNILSPTITACGSFSNNGRILKEGNWVADDVIDPDLAWVNELLM